MQQYKVIKWYGNKYFQFYQQESHLALEQGMHLRNWKGHITQQYHFASMAAQLSSKGIPHYDPLLYFPSGLLTTINSSLCPGIGFQSICPSSPLPCVPGELGPCPGNLVLQQGLSVWFSLHSDCRRSAVALSHSLKCFSSVPNNCPDVGI